MTCNFMSLSYQDKKSLQSNSSVANVFVYSGCTLIFDENKIIDNHTLQVRGHNRDIFFDFL